MRENHRLKPRHFGPAGLLALVLLLVLLLGPGWSQSTPAQPAAPPPPQSPNQSAPAAQSANPPAPNSSPTTQVPGAGVSVQEQVPGSTPQESSQQPQTETRITKAQAKELFRSVDVILNFASRDTGLAVKSEVKRRLITRESMEKYVSKRMKDDKDAQRLEQSRLVLEKFGLLPKDYDLHSEFLRLLAEQVAAYYDPKTRSVNLLDWVPPVGRAGRSLLRPQDKEREPARLGAARHAKAGAGA